MAKVANVSLSVCRRTNLSVGSEMSSVTINCPKCGSGLKLPNRSMLGRKGKCPKCEHKFVLEEPDEVQLELAEPDPAPGVSLSDAPKVGMSAKWVPDQPAVRPTAASAVPAFTAAAPAADVFDFSALDASTTTPPAAPINAADGGVTGDSNLAGSAAGAAQGSVAGRIRRRPKKRRGGPVAIGIGTALLAFCMLGLWWQQNNSQPVVADQNAGKQLQKNVDWEAEKVDQAASDEDAKTLSPTKGGPIPMEFLPFTPHLVCHLRPSEIWAADRTNKEFVATLGSVGTWLQNTISGMTKFEPQEIEELTFVVNFGPRSSPPDVAAVVRLKTAHTDSDFQLKRFEGTPHPDPNVRLFEGETYAYLLLDSKTFVVASNSVSDLLMDAKTHGRQPPVDLEALIAESDRTRQMSLMFDVINIDTHREYIFEPDMVPFADQFVLWFGKDIQTLSWSMHLGTELFMETLLHPSSTSSAMRVQRHMKQRFQELPGTLQSAARFMKPANQGYKAMIGRFPAMMQAFVLGTSSNVGPSFVRLTTLLPDKAAANIAAASLYTWNQSVVTDFTGPAPVVNKGPSMPDKIADRLKMPVIVDFRRMPLQEAFAYIADEIKTTITINGDALKLAGMTQNMPQTYNLGEVPALAAIDAMLSNPDYKGTLVIIVDETTKTITLTTRPVATESGLTPYPTK